MVGLAGTGYGMLRVAAPDEVPAILAMQPMP
jgi:lantibiotic modifying enzyme